MVDVDTLVGTVLDGRFRIDAVIGAGGMGVVYRATQLNVDRPVAVKVLRPELTKGGGDLVQRFEREARIIARLTHPHILRLIDFGHTEQGAMYIVTELVQGQPLNKLLERGLLSPRRTVKLLHQICAAMEDFHAAGIVHRDLKPANLIVELVNGDDFVRVLDFGIARDDGGPSLTLSQTLLGTPAYMSPEQARGENATVASDLYSLGIIAYECLSGLPPFYGEAALAILVRQINDPPPPLSAVMPDAELPPELSRLVMQLLAKDPRERPQSAAEVRRRLERIEEGPTQAVQPPTPAALYLAAPTPEPYRVPTEQATPASVFSDPASVPLEVAQPGATPSRALRGSLAALVLGGVVFWALLIWVLATTGSSSTEPVDAALTASSMPVEGAETSSSAPSEAAARRRRPRRAQTTRVEPEQVEDALLTVEPVSSSGASTMAELFIDGVRRSQGTSIQLRLAPGNYLVEVVSADGKRAKKSVRLASGDSRKETLVLDARPTRRPR